MAGAAGLEPVTVKNRRPSKPYRHTVVIAVVSRVKRRNCIGLKSVIAVGVWSLHPKLSPKLEPCYNLALAPKT